MSVDIRHKIISRKKNFNFPFFRKLFYCDLGGCLAFYLVRQACYIFRKEQSSYTSMLLSTNQIFFLKKFALSKYYSSLTATSPKHKLPHCLRYAVFFGKLNKNCFFYLVAECFNQKQKIIVLNF